MIFNLDTRTVDERKAEELLRPLRAEPVGSDLVDLLVTRVAGAMLLVRLEGRRDREIEMVCLEGQTQEWVGRLKYIQYPPVTDATNEAARLLLFLAGIEGIKSLSRGGKGCVFRALEALRPDIAARWLDGEHPQDLLNFYFPEGL